MSGFEHVLNRVRAEVYRVMQIYSHPKVGEVSAYDPETHMVKVKLKPRDNETGWIPLSVHHVGNGFGVMFAPDIGDQVEISMQEGDSNTARLIGRWHSDKQKPPVIQAGEGLLKFKNGAGIYFDKAGNMHFVTPNGNVHINETSVP